MRVVAGDGTDPANRHRGGKHFPKTILRFARQFRGRQTDAEGRLWYLLRDRRLDAFKFRRQHPVDRFILDFYCSECKLAIEVDGGGHNASRQSLDDKERDRLLAQHGIQVLRFWNNEVLSNTEGVLEAIWEALKSPEQRPSP